MSDRLDVNILNAEANELSLGGATAYHLPNWHQMSHPERLAMMRQIAMMRGRDPRIAKKALSIIRKAGAKPREYEKQASALLKWVQDPKNCYYINEPGERLQDPIYTLKVKHGDCDDMVILLCSFLESINLPWRQVLSGRDSRGKKIRYIEGQPIPQGCEWVHIYCMVGTPPFQPNRWFFCEPTVQGVPLGWDVLSGDKAFLPELAKRKRGGRQYLMPSPKARFGTRKAKLPPPHRRSPAYSEVYGGDVSAFVGASVAGSMEENEGKGIDWANIGSAVATGVAVSVGTQLILDYVRGRGVWSNSGDILTRWKNYTDYIADIFTPE